MRAVDGHDFQFNFKTLSWKPACFIFSALLLSSAAIGPAAAATPTSCANLSTFSYPNTTINYALSQPGGPYVAPDAWHLAFTNLPPYCEVSATIAADHGFQHQCPGLDADAKL